MNALQIRSPMVAGVIETARPVPGPNEVLVAVELCGVCGTDVELFQGTMPYVKQGLSTYPIVPGHEWCGRIVEAGAEVPAHAIGRRIVPETVVGCGACEACQAGRPNLCSDRQEIGILRSDGGLADYAVVPWRAVHSIADSVESIDGALVEPLAVGLQALRGLGVTAQDRVMVIGLGTVGSLAAAAAHSMGATVAALDSNDSRRDVAQRAQCAAFWNDASEVRATDHDAFSVVVEASGGYGSFDTALSLVQPGGRIGILGLTPGVDHVESHLIATKSLAIRGFIGSTGVWDDAIHMVEAKLVRPGAILETRVTPLSCAPQILERMASGEERAIKHLVRPLSKTS